MIKNLHFLSILLFVSVFATSGCIKDSLPTPTKTLMEGTWELTAATDAAGKNILAAVAFPVTVIQLGNDNGMTGTQSPMFTYTVYGGSQWVIASAKIKQTFDYANFNFSTGEFFVDGGTPDRFTVEAKLQAAAGYVGGLADVLTALGVGSGYLQQTIYHKFIDVKVTIPGEIGSDRSTMIWEFDNQTTAVYNYKDSKGNIVLWGGWPVSGFSKGTFTFTKRIKTLTDIVNQYK